MPMPEDEMEIRKFLLREFHNGLSAQQACKKLFAKYGQVTGYAHRSCQRWFNKFRAGDLDLNIKPVEKKLTRKQKARMIREEKKARLAAAAAAAQPKRPPSKTVKVDSATFKYEKVRSATAVESNRSDSSNSVKTNDAVQRLIRRNPELTVSSFKEGAAKQKPPTQPNILMKRLISPTADKSEPKKSAPAVPVNQSRFQVNGVTKPRTRSSLEAQLTLPASIAKRMTHSDTLTESHRIGDGSKAPQKPGEPARKSITVQFQNINPALAKNTVRKSIEKVAPPSGATGNKRLPQTSPLCSQKGVIYLNPQEIFKQSLDYRSPMQRQPASNNAGPKRNQCVSKTPHPGPAVVAPQNAASATLTISDSESEDEVIFPTDAPIPPPKPNPLAETFTTYWDMETGKPILLNPTEEIVMPTPTVPVIEID